MSEKKPKYYERLVLAREYVVRSTMLRVDPTNKENTTDSTLDEYSDLWNEYYAIYKFDDYGESCDMVEDGIDFDEISKSYISSLYELYVEDFDPAEGEPVSFEEWRDNDLPQILGGIFGDKE